MPRTTTIIDELVTQLETIKTPTFAITFGQIDRYDVPLVDNDQITFPHLSIIDNGQEIKRVDKDYNSFTRFDWEVIIRGAVKADTLNEIYAELAKLESSVKQLIDSEPAITNVLQWKHTETIDRLFDVISDSYIGAFTLRTRFIYTAGSGAF